MSGSQNHPGFLDHLVESALGAATVVRPRVPSLFEPEGPSVAFVPHTAVEPMPEVREDWRPVVERRDPSAEPPATRRPRRVAMDEPDETSAPLDPPRVSHAEPTPPRGERAALPAPLVESRVRIAAALERAADEPASPAPDARPREANRSSIRAAPDHRALQHEPSAPRAATRGERGHAVLRMSEALLPHTALDVRSTIRLHTEESPARARFDAPAFHALRPTSSPLGRQDMLAPPDVPREPDVHVTIGRIEVRAMPEPKPTRTEPRKGAPLSLDDYLKGRREGAR